MRTRSIIPSGITTHRGMMLAARVKVWSSVRRSPHQRRRQVLQLHLLHHQEWYISIVVLVMAVQVVLALSVDNNTRVQPRI